jgi:hypothetical protein
LPSAIGRIETIVLLEIMFFINDTVGMACQIFPREVLKLPMPELFK